MKTSGHLKEGEGERKEISTVTARIKNPQGHLSTGSVHLEKIYGNLQSVSGAGVSVRVGVKSRGDAYRHMYSRSICLCA